MQEALRRALCGAVREVKVNEPFNFSEGAFWPDFSYGASWVHKMDPRVPFMKVSCVRDMIFYNGEFDPGSG